MLAQLAQLSAILSRRATSLTSLQLLVVVFIYAKN